MTSAVYLVRHGEHALFNRVLCGRADGIGLAPTGIEQAHRLADHFARRRIDLVQCSPRQRTRETAAPIAERLGLRPRHEDAVDEIDIGDWTGRSLDSLSGDPEWIAWNSRRDATRPPGGESMAELQRRVVAHLESLRHVDGEAAVIVTHAEPIRAAVLHCRRMSLDRFGEIEIAPASISVFKLNAQGLELATVNQTVPS